MCLFLYGGKAPRGNVINVDCSVYSNVAQGPPHLESGMGLLKLESLKDALGETWMLMAREAVVNSIGTCM